MLKHENIICISTIDWDFIWQGHQEIMATFARNGNRVLFIENTGVRAPGIRDITRVKKRIEDWFKGVKGIRKERENLYVFSPLVLPFPYSRIAIWINRHLILSILKRWGKIVDFNDPIVWTFLPSGLALSLIDNMEKKLVVYYCIADFQKLVRSTRKVMKTEKRLIRKSDLVFVQGEELKKHCEKNNKNISIFPFGVNADRFLNYDYSEKRPSDISHIKGLIIGYIGGVHRHIDLELIKFLAEKNTNWTFLFIGPIQADISLVRHLNNVVFLKKKDHEELPRYIANFNVCLVPYVLNEYTKTVYPTKLNEYLAMGKAVISTALPEIESFNKKYSSTIYIGRDKEGFERCIKMALDEDSLSLKKKRIEIAKENDWKDRIEQMSRLIKEEMEKKRINIELKWKENLVSFYRRARKNTFYFVGIFFICYILLFKTSFLWFLAEPLKITDIPQKADSIVVFGGGVGETGSPGKSTIERARYAVRLYKDGYAGKIIFSSGYTYIYNDAENMRLFAMSMGVPDRDIILEEKANSAYENVVFSKDILNKYGYHSILLISSPYNMRRVFLVFKRLNSDIKVFYMPDEKSQFFDRIEGVKLVQIRAIVHEYLGIAYYYLKRYILSIKR